MDTKLNYADHLKEVELAHALLQRKLRTSYVMQQVKSLSLIEIRDLYRTIHHGESPRSGQLPAIDSIAQYRESFLYLSVFASLYCQASQGRSKFAIEVSAILFAWDFFCQIFPNHIRERRPLGKIRPANFSEAWVVAQALKVNLASLRYCEKCHGESLIIYQGKFPPKCQICHLETD